MASRSTRRFETFARAAARSIVERARAVLLDEPDATRERAAAELAAARELQAGASELKAGMAKLGQLLAYIEGPDALESDGARGLLANLWDRAPAVDGAAIRRVVEAELGAPISERFASWSDEPFAAASLGQVHAATTPDGTRLAVKVQYPGIADALAADLAGDGFVRRLAGAGAGAAIDDAALATLRAALLGELDYVAEGRSLERFRRAWLGDRTIVVPRIDPARSSLRVLSAERLDGTRLAELAAQGSTAERAACALTIFRYAWGNPIQHGLVNADPNPGNYLVLDAAAGRIGFVDYGCCAQLSEELVAAERMLWRGLYYGDGERMRYAVQEQGLLGRGRALDSDTFRRWERYLAGPFLGSGDFTFTPAYARGLTEVTSDLLHAGGLRLPAPALLLWRARLGAVSVLGSLSATADFRAALRQIVSDAG